MSELKVASKEYKGPKIYSYKKSEEPEYKKVGKYEYDIEKIIKNSIENSKYCLVEERSEYYKCMFDLDYKPYYEKKYLEENETITKYIIEKIEESITKITTGSITTDYIILKKNKGLGVHIIYPFIIINTEIHMKIYIEMMIKIKEEKTYPIEIMEKIIDKGVIQSLGIRLPYNISKGEYYYPIIEESTYKFDDEESKEEHIRTCLINTKSEKSNIELKIEIQDDESICEETIEYNNICEDTISCITLDTTIKENKKNENNNDNNDNEKLYKILDLIDIKYIDQYDDWKRICWSLRSIGEETKEIAKKISKKSKKYDEKGFEKIWNNYNEREITEKTIYYYAKKSNGKEFQNIITKYKQEYTKINNKEYMKINNQDDKNLEKYKKLITILKDGQLTIAEYFCNQYKTEIIYCKDNWYVYDNEIKLWHIYNLKHINNIKTIYAQFIRKEISECITICNNKNMNEELKYLTQEKQKCTNAKFACSISMYFQKYLNNDEIEQKMNGNRKVINFKNGLLNLETGIFRERIKEDYLSFTLPYNYDENKINKKKIIFIKSELLKMTNNKEELLEFILMWNAYCITGETNMQKLLFIIGHTASNGKSTISRIYEKVFPNYFVQLDKRTFNEDYTKSHKQLMEIKYKRYIYIEELDQKKIDVSLIKSIVDNGSIPIEILYGTKLDMIIYGKLNGSSNHDLVFKSDNGIKRRGLALQTTNQFVEKEFVDEKNGKYLMDRNFLDLFDDEEYKMSYVSILLEYTQKYYKDKTFKIPKNISNEFNDVCDNNDIMSNFLETYFTITLNENDIISKTNFMNLWDIENNKYDSKYVLSEIKRFNLKYDKSKRLNNQRGVIIGIKLINLGM